MLRPVLLLALGLAGACAGDVDADDDDDAVGDGGGDPDGGLGDPDGGGGGEDPSAELYDPDRVPVFELELPPASVEALENDPRLYAPGTLRYGDEVVENIGVRLKGEYTFRPLTEKAAFKLKFDEFVPDQTFRGLKRMTLNAGIEDPSFVAERLTYTAFRAAALPAPRANSAWVRVNGEDFGLYVNLETEDKRMIARWFADAGGNLYEEQAQELLPGNEQAFELETNEAADDRSDLIALIAAIDAADDATLLEDLADVLDGDAFLRFCAMELIVNQWDGYCYTQFGPNNFRLYADPGTGRFHFLPWGMDMSWKPWSGNDGIALESATGLVLQKCLNGASCRDAYEATIAEMADLVDGLDLPGLVDAWYAQIYDLADADPRREFGMDTFEDHVATVRERAAARTDEVRAQLP
jgi:spore coat protein CotH